MPKRDVVRRIDQRAATGTASGGGSGAASGNADTVDGIHANRSAAAGVLLALDSSAKYPLSALATTGAADNDLLAYDAAASAIILQSAAEAGLVGGTTGNLTATSPISIDQTRQVIGGAAVISHAATAGNIHLPTGGTANQILKNSGTSGEGAWGTVTESAGVLGAVSAVRPATDSATALQFQTSSGTAVVTVDTINSRVGIGISPTAAFHVSGTTYTLGRFINTDSNSYAQLYTQAGTSPNHGNIWVYAFGAGDPSGAQYVPASGMIESSTGGGLGISAAHASAVIRFYTAGNNERVRIGGTYTLDVTGNGRFTTGILGPAWKPTADSVTAMQLQNAAGSNVVNIDTVNGRLGINTAAPAARLEIARTGTTAGGVEFIRLSNTSNNIDVGSYIAFRDGGYSVDNARIAGVRLSGSAQGYMAISTRRDESTIMEKIRIGYLGLALGDNYVSTNPPTQGAIIEGKVGIGTTAPGTSLEIKINDAVTNAVTNVLTLSHTTSGTAASGLGVGALFHLEDGSGNVDAAGALNIYWQTATNGAEDTTLELTGLKTNVSMSRIKSTATELVLNEDSADIDLRVESDGEANMLFVDAGSDYLYIGGTTNGVRIDKGGEMTLLGTATIWDDMQLPIAAGKAPAANYPSWEGFTTNTSAYAFSVDDYIDVQAGEPPHGWKEGAAADVHLHFCLKAAQTSGSNRYVKFTVWLAIADAGGAWSELSPFTLEKEIPTGTAAKTSYLLDLGDATLTGYHIGMQLIARVKRIAATGGTEYADDVYITQVGMHFERDTMGSKTETAK